MPALGGPFAFVYRRKSKINKCPRQHRYDLVEHRVHQAIRSSPSQIIQIETGNGLMGKL